MNTKKYSLYTVILLYAMSTLTLFSNDKKDEQQQQYYLLSTIKQHPKKVIAGSLLSAAGLSCFFKALRCNSLANIKFTNPNSDRQCYNIGTIMFAIVGTITLTSGLSFLGYSCLHTDTTQHINVKEINISNGSFYSIYPSNKKT